MNQSWCEFARAYYVDLWPKVKAVDPWVWACGPTEIDWPMSPIERVLWGFIRDEGIVLYPQHPCAGYFVDFGHPKARVAIECDGEEFHKDKAKDEARQAAIEAKGWTVYRLTGSQCNRHEYRGYGQEEGLNPAQELLRHVGLRHRLSSKLRKEDEIRAQKLQRQLERET